MSLTFERKLPTILLFVFLMLTTIGVVFYLGSVSLQDTIENQRRAKDFVSIVDNTVEFAFEANSVLFNFVLTSNDSYLDPFERGKPKIRQNIEKLRTLAADRPEMANDINRLDQTIKEFTSEVSAKIDRRKMNGPGAASEEIPWAEGQRMLDTIRSSGERLKAIETESLRRSEQAGSLRYTMIVWILIVSSIAGIVSLIFANRTVISEIRKRRNAENDLLQANEGLEQKVQERTQELKIANEKLLEAGVERESILFSEKQARREAEVANRLRDEFMATVSHELRTPLNSILGWARLMKDGSLDNAQFEKALSTIIKNSESQNRLIEDLLDVARVISGKLPLELIELGLSEVLRQALDSVRPVAEAKNIDIEFNDDEPEIAIRGDLDRLVQVFTNLLGNAVKFSQPGTNVSIVYEISGENAVVRIKDRGKGISPEFLPKVFERFRQDTSSISNNGGLGLGLAIVRNLVEMHGGSVAAESEGEGRGSTFTVLLPLAGTDVEQSPPASAGPEPI